MESILRVIKECSETKGLVAENCDKCKLRFMDTTHCLLAGSPKYWKREKLMKALGTLSKEDTFGEMLDYFRETKKLNERLLKDAEEYKKVELYIKSRIKVDTYKHVIEMIEAWAKESSKVGG